MEATGWSDVPVNNLEFRGTFESLVQRAGDRLLFGEEAEFKCHLTNTASSRTILCSVIRSIHKNSFDLVLKYLKAIGRLAFKHKRDLYSPM